MGNLGSCVGCTVAYDASIKAHIPSNLEASESRPQPKENILNDRHRLHTSSHETRIIMKLFSVASVALYELSPDNRSHRLANSTCRLQISGALAQTWGPPSGAITWENLGHIRVYAVDPKGNIREWQYDGNGWTGPTYIGSNAVPGSALTAVNDGSRVS